MRAAIATAFVVIHVCASRGAAQSAASQIVGHVSDPMRASVPGVQLQLRNVDTGIERVTSTNDEGYYTMSMLPPGVYRMVAQREGFRPVVRSRLRLEVGQTLQLDIALTIGTLSDVIQVTADEPLLQRATSELGSVAEHRAITGLPLNGRDFQQLLTLAPGVNGRSVNGQWSATNLYYLDGVINTRVLNTAAAVVPILDSIQEFKLQSHNDKAEYGGVLGGIANVVSKSGTNELHGSAWEFVRNDRFDARNPFTDARRSGPPPFRQNQFGGTLGGPVRVPALYDGTNRTFFFAAYEAYRYRRPASSLMRVPSEAELNGDFSGFERQIFDPATESFSEGRYIREVFPGNRIAHARISPMMSSALGLLYDSPNLATDGFFNRVSMLGSSADRNSYSIKIDHQLNPIDSLWARYSWSNENSMSRLSESLLEPRRSANQNGAVTWVRTLSNSVLLTMSVSRSNQPIETWNELRESSPGALAATGFPMSNIDRFGMLHLGLGAPWTSPWVGGYALQGGSQPFSFSNSISWQGRTHNVQVGGVLVRTRFRNIARGHHLTFSDAQTGDPSSAAKTGASLASALLGLPANIGYTSTLYIENFATWGLYFQDEWKLQPSLSLNWGIRYDQFPSPNFSEGMINLWDHNTGDWLIGGSALPPACRISRTAPCIPGDGSLSSIPYGNRIRLADSPGIRHPIRDNFGPRAGIAWAVRPKSVLRAGYGIVFDTFSATAQDMQNPTGTWPAAGSIQKSMNGAGSAPTTVESIEAGPLPLLPSSSPWDTAAWFWDPAKKNAYSQQWNAELQWQPSEHLMASAAYVGSRSSRLDMIIAANTALYSAAGSPQEVQARKPYPYMVTTQYGTDWGRGDYHALQTKLHRRFQDGLFFLAAYTWSKSMDNGASAWFGRPPQDSHHPESSRGPSDYDRTHSMIISSIYELPVGVGKRWLNHGLTSRVLGAWQANTMTTLQSGAPINLIVRGDVANVGNTVQDYARPNLVGDPRPEHRTNAIWYLPQLFAAPVFGYGNFGRNVLRAAPAYNCDLSLIKSIALTERIRSEIRVEAFNVFNLMNPGTPETNVLSPNAGRVSSISGRPREIQFAMKVSF